MAAQQSTSFEKVFEALPTACVILDAADQIVYANKAAANMLGYSVEELTGMQISHLLAPDASDDGLGLVDNSTHQSAWITKAGVQVQANVSTKPIDNESGTHVLVLHDATRCRHREQCLQRSRDFYLTLFDDFPALIWRIGTDAKCNYVNKAWLTFTGRSMEQEMAGGWLKQIHPDDVTRFMDTYLKAFETRQPFEAEFRLRRHDGEYRWIQNTGKPFFDLDGTFSGYIGSCYDITDHKLMEEALLQKALYDPLTGLSNRTSFLERAEHSMIRARFSGGHVVIFFLDIDDFKGINDTYGHLFGDGLLKAVAQRLRQTMRADDTVCRFGGDEFVILANVDADGKIDRVARKIYDAVKQPFHVDGTEIEVTTSIGIGVYPHDGDTLDALLQAADNALYSSKESGKDTYRFASSVESMSDANTGDYTKVPVNTERTI